MKDQNSLFTPVGILLATISIITGVFLGSVIDSIYSTNINEIETGNTPVSFPVSAPILPPVSFPTSKEPMMPRDDYDFLRDAMSEDDDVLPEDETDLLIICKSLLEASK